MFDKLGDKLDAELAKVVMSLLATKGFASWGLLHLWGVQRHGCILSGNLTDCPQDVWAADLTARKAKALAWDK